MGRENVAEMEIKVNLSSFLSYLKYLLFPLVRARRALNALSTFKSSDFSWMAKLKSRDFVLTKGGLREPLL